MARKRVDGGEGERFCCHRRALLRGLGAAGMGLLLGRCSTSAPQDPDGVDRGAAVADGGVVTTEQGAPLVDTSFSGSDGGLPPIDLAAPSVTQTATFALG